MIYSHFKDIFYLNAFPSIYIKVNNGERYSPFVIYPNFDRPRGKMI